MKNKSLDIFIIFNTVFMIILVLSIVFPFIYIINMSLSKSIYVMQNSVFFYPKGFTLEWYRQVLSDPRIGTGYRNTIFYTVAGTLISLILTSVGAYALSQRKMILRRFFSLFIVFTLLFGGGMIPSYLVMKSYGIVNTIWAMLLPGAVNTYNLLVFRTFFEQLPEELFDSGKIDGLDYIGMFIHIVVPLSKAVYAAIGLFVAVDIWNNYYSSLIYLRDSNLYPLQAILRDIVIAGTAASQAAENKASRQNDDMIIISLKYATIIVSTLPILMVYPFLQKYFVKGMLIGAIKA